MASLDTALTSYTLLATPTTVTAFGGATTLTLGKAGGATSALGTWTLTSPTLSGTVGGALSWSGAQTFSAGAVIAASQALTGTAANSTISGFLSISGTTLTGTLSTAAQPNVTSLGTIAALVAGTGTFSSTLGATGNFTGSALAAIGAAINTSIGLALRPVGLTAGTTQYGLYADPTFTSASTSAAYAGFFQPRYAAASYTTTNSYGLYIDDAAKGAGQTITNQYGLYIASQAQGGTLNYAIYTNSGAVHFGGNTDISGTFTATGTARLNGGAGFTVGVVGAANENVELSWGSNIATFDIYDRTAATYRALKFNALSYNFSANGSGNSSLTIASTGAVAAPYVWANTGGTTAMLVDSAGTFFKAVSARKYKDVGDKYDKGLSEVLKFDPRYYRMKFANGAGPMQAGLIADDLDAQGLKEFVAYGPDGEVDGLSPHSTMFALFANSFKDVDARLRTLEQRH